MQNQLSTEVNVDDLGRLGKMLAMSGYFDTQRGDMNVAIAQMCTKVLAGRELGFGPFASANGIHIIKGKPVIGANLIAAAVKASGRYNYRVATMTDTECTINFMERMEDKWVGIGTSTFTAADAKKAGTGNMDKFGRNMLFARAISNGVRWYCPDVFLGSTVYVPGELDGDTTDVSDTIVLEDAHGLLSVTVTDEPEPVERLPYGYSEITDGFVSWCRDLHANSSGECSPQQHGYLTGLINKIIGSEDEQDHRNVMEVLVGRPVDKDHRMGAELADALIPLISKTKRGPTPKSRIPKPDYDQDVVDSIREIWAHICAQEFSPDRAM